MFASFNVPSNDHDHDHDRNYDYDYNLFLSVFDAASRVAGASASSELANFCQQDYVVSSHSRHKSACRTLRFQGGRQENRR